MRACFHHGSALRAFRQAMADNRRAKIDLFIRIS
jgi:hypothetical protein